MPKIINLKAQNLTKIVYTQPNCEKLVRLCPQLFSNIIFGKRSVTYDQKTMLELKLEEVNFDCLLF